MLAHLGGNGVGVDHNPHSIATARARGLEAYVPDDFLASANAVPGSFDSLLMAHVLEHVDREAGLELIKSYLGFVRPGGKVCLITPQERGYRSDPTHVRFVDVEELESIAGELGLTGTRSYSFPFPRFAGRRFTYNEFVFVARVPERAA